MPDQLYAIDASGVSLAPLPTPPTVYPNLLTYTFQELFLGSGNTFQNFFGEEVAIIAMSAHLFLSASATWTFDAKINGSSIISQGSPSPLAVTMTNGAGFNYSDVWTPSDLPSSPLLGVGDKFAVTLTNTNNSSGSIVGFDVCMVPSAQLPLLAA